MCALERDNIFEPLWQLNIEPPTSRQRQRWGGAMGVGDRESQNPAGHTPNRPEAAEESEGGSLQWKSEAAERRPPYPRMLADTFMSHNPPNFMDYANVASVFSVRAEIGSNVICDMSHKHGRM